MRTIFLTGLLAVAMLLGGCGGYYTVTLPDHVAASGEEAPVVVRLQRNDFFVLNLAMKGMPMRFRAGSGPERAAYTDKLGYAGTTVPCPEVPGRYPLEVNLHDYEGEEVSAQSGLYVWDAANPVLAVELACLPPLDSPDNTVAAAAIETFARDGHIVYLTQKPVADHWLAHSNLLAGGYPDGPVLLWRRERWHITRGKWNMPQVVVESRLVSQIAELKSRFPTLTGGLCHSELAADALLEAGVAPIMVGPQAWLFGSTGFESWEQLESRGIAQVVRSSPMAPVAPLEDRK